MGYLLEDFLDDWLEESRLTLAVFEQLSSESLSIRVTALDRSLGQVALHIIESMGDIVSHLGVSLVVVDAAISADDAAVLVEVYRARSSNLVQALRVANPAMEIEHDVYGMRWTTQKTLTVLMRHEIHHRAQMTVLMRQAGLSLPDIYGPSRGE